MTASKTIARVFPFRRPVALLLSYPRSGSSWMGEVLSKSPSIAYLREPVTQAFVKHSIPGTVCDPAESAMRLEAYRRFAGLAFAGVPPSGADGIVGSLDRFLLHTRNRRTLLIKEVNPRAAGFYAERYAPFIMLLVRHPAAVADSYDRMGWLPDRDWERFGHTYGTTVEEARKVCLDTHGVVLVFEEVALHPRESFARLFGRLNASLPYEFDGLLQEYCELKSGDNGPYGTRRHSEAEIAKWRSSLDKNQVLAIKSGFMQTELPYYRHSSDWS